MKSSKNQIELKSKISDRIWVIFGLGGITLYINSRMEDPFNTPKFIILLLTAMILMAAVISEIKTSGINKNKNLSLIFIFLFIFLISNLVSALLTDVKFTAFFGEYQRRNGFLTYLCLVIFMIFSIFYGMKNDAKYFLKNAFWIAIIFTIYGVLQSQGIDFVKWNNPYNSIIATVGNPNFASALASIIACALIAILTSNQFSIFLRIASTLVVLLSLFIIIKSQSRQGLVSFSTGLLVICTLVVWKKNKKAGVLIAVTSFSIVITAILGMFQFGPLERFLYKESVSVRGFYWRAGFEMFKSNPFFGVGVDRYGAYFKEFREAAYPLRYGYEITSTNAHNVIIQLFSTGGLFVGLSYVAILIYVLQRGLKLVFNSSDNDRNIYVGLFGSWIAFQAQSVISIDNIGISIWGWIIGGILIGSSFKDYNQIALSKTRKIKQIELFQPMLTGVLLVPALIVGTLLYRSENQAWLARSFYNPNQPALNPQLNEYSISVISNPLSDPFLKFRVSGYLVASGNSQIGLAELKKLSQIDPRNLDYLRVLAVYSYQLGDINSSIKYRKETLKFDPQNTKNILELGKLYKLQNDTNSVEEMKNKILALDPNGEDAKTIELIISQ